MAFVRMRNILMECEKDEGDNLIGRTCRNPLTFLSSSCTDILRAWYTNPTENTIRMRPYEPGRHRILTVECLSHVDIVGTSTIFSPGPDSYLMSCIILFVVFALMAICVFGIPQRFFWYKMKPKED